MIKFLILFITVIFNITVAFAQSTEDESFVIKDIRLQGLQRISSGSVFNLLPLNAGLTANTANIQETIRALFLSGFFDDIKVFRDDDVLILQFHERPSIEKIDFEGNKSIKTEALIEGLASSGLSENDILQRSILDRIEVDLLRQYISQGRYASSVNTTTTNLPGNKVAIKISIVEGAVSKISRIIFIGNKNFEDKELAKFFELKQPGFLSFITSDNKFSREKLSGDLEKLEAFYQDRGFLDFRILSSQISVTPDKSNVFITINMDEGKKFVVSKVTMTGDFGDINPKILKRLLLIRSKTVFSKAQITATEELLSSFLGRSGYNLARITGIPEIDAEGNVKINFIVNSGKRVYARRIEFSGNRVTKDHVMRREMRQLEGSWVSDAKIEISKIRLERLGFFKEVSVDTVPVEGIDDQIDIFIKIEEHPSGSISAGVGYAQQNGFLVNAGFQERNLLGSGNLLNLNLSWTKYQQRFNITHYDPYYTADGISRTLNFSLSTVDTSAYSSFVSFVSDSIRGGFTIGYPVNETESVRLGFSSNHTRIAEQNPSEREVADFLNTEGFKYLNHEISLSWGQSKLNRGIFPTAGHSQSLSINLALPGSDLGYYKLIYSAQKYIPLHRFLSLRLNTSIGFGDSYEKGSTLPFYENFRLGGFGSIRGFSRYSLGPRSTSTTILPLDADGNELPPIPGRAFGGNLSFVANIELLINTPLSSSGGSFRPAIFFDVGQVFNTRCPDYADYCFGLDASRLSYSIGAGVTWLSPLGPMTFSLSKPFNGGPFANEESFQFEIGQSF